MPETALEYAQAASDSCALPEVYLQLKQMINDQAATVDDLEGVISGNDDLTSTILSLANSALFSFPREIDSIAKVLAVLGRDKLGALLDTYGATQAFSQVSHSVLDLDKFWQMSVDCALICKFLAKKKGLTAKTDLFLSGLLHNVGELAVMQVTAKKVQYCEAYDKAQTPWQRQEDIFGFYFSNCTVELLRLWQLSEDIITPIEQYTKAVNEPLSAVLYIASHAAVINTYPKMYPKKAFISPQVMRLLDFSFDDINEAIDYCNAQGMEIMAALKLKH